MFTYLFLSALLASVAVIRADPNPSEPSPGDIFNEGATCKIVWDADTTGTWKTMNIELMSGSNLAMNHITTVLTVDGTDATNNTYEYPCPKVTPNSAIYFYQFTSPSSTDTLWTTRFTIADATGTSVAPANAKQPNGDAIPWGTGALVDPSQAVPAPAAGLATANSSVPVSSAASSSAVSTPLAVTPSSTLATSASSSTPSSAGGLLKVSSSSTPSKTASVSASPSSVNGASANGAVAIELPFFHMAVTLGVTALAFAFTL